MRKSKSLSFEGEQKKKSRNLKNFIFAFSVFVILLGSVSLLMFMKHLNFDIHNIFSSAESTTETTTLTTTEAIPLTGEASVLLVCENSEHTLDFVILVDCDYENNRMTFRDIPVSTVISYDSFSSTLNDYYVQYGYSTFRDAAVGSLNLKADRYIKFNVSQFRSFLTKFGDVTVTLENPIDDSADGLILNAGEQSLSADLFIKYVNYCDSYHKADALAAFARTVMTKEHSVKAESLFTYIANHSQTDVTIVDFKAHEDRLVGFCSNSHEIVAISQTQDGED